MGVRFYLGAKGNKNGDKPIQVKISLGGSSFFTSGGYSMHESKWDDAAQRVKQGCSNAKGETFLLINGRLNDVDSHFSKIETRFKIGDIDSIDIKHEYQEHFSRKKPTVTNNQGGTIFDRIDEFISTEGRRNNWSSSVNKKFHTLKKHLIILKKDLDFDFFNEAGLSKFVDYLLTDAVISGAKTKEKDTRVFGMKNSTVKKQVKFLKWFLRWAVSKGYNTETAFETFKPKLTTSENKIVFLTWEELMRVYLYPIPESKKYLDRVRDFFCLCCFTSLRYSDVANLRRSDVHADHIEITTIKTADSLKIDLNDHSRTILKKYEGMDFPGNRALPVISNQRMNEYLKELGELCEINEPVTITYFKGSKRFDEVYPKYALIGTHTGRRTFISNAIMMGIPPQVVMKWTGHSDYKSMQPYIDIADREKATAMKMFNRK